MYTSTEDSRLALRIRNRNCVAVNRGFIMGSEDGYQHLEDTDSESEGDPPLLGAQPRMPCPFIDEEAEGEGDARLHDDEDANEDDEDDMGDFLNDDELDEEPPLPMNHLAVFGAAPPWKSLERRDSERMLHKDAKDACRRTM